MDQEPRTTSVFSLSTLVFPHTKQFFFFYSGWKMNKTMTVPEVNILTLHTFLIPFLMRMLALTLSNKVYCSVYETFANITFDYVYNGFIILLFECECDCELTKEMQKVRAECVDSRNTIILFIYLVVSLFLG